MKLKTILISTFISVAAVAAAGTSAALLINKSNYSNSNDFASPVKSEVFGKNFSFTIQKHSAVETTVLENKEQEVYTISIVQDEASKEQGSIYFIAKGADKIEEKQTITFKPGDDIEVGVKYKDTQKQNTNEKLTIRDLLVWGKNQNHFVKTEKNVDGTYTIKTPTVKEATGIDGENWFYAKDTQINVKATFIKESIGTETKWTHGAYFGDLNGYVYNLKSDTSWSAIKSTIYSTFENKDIKNPIDVYVFLNGFTLTVDEQITDAYTPSGWALHFHNNNNETKATNNKYGKIVGVLNKDSSVVVKGSLHLGKSVEFNTIPTTTGVSFLADEEVSTWIGVTSNNPNK